MKSRARQLASLMLGGSVLAFLIVPMVLSCKPRFGGDLADFKDDVLQTNRHRVVTKVRSASGENGGIRHMASNLLPNINEYQAENAKRTPRLATVDENGRVQIFNPKAKRGRSLIGSFSIPLVPNKNNVEETVRDIAVSPSGRYVAVTLGLQGVYLLKVGARGGIQPYQVAPRFLPKHAADKVAFVGSADEDHFFVASQLNKPKIDVYSLEEVEDLKPGSTVFGPVNTLTIQNEKAGSVSDIVSLERKYGFAVSAGYAVEFHRVMRSETEGGEFSWAWDECLNMIAPTGRRFDRPEYDIYPCRHYGRSDQTRAKFEEHAVGHDYGALTSLAVHRAGLARPSEHLDDYNFGYTVIMGTAKGAVFVVDEVVPWAGHEVKSDWFQGPLKKRIWFDGDTNCTELKIPAVIEIYKPMDDDDQCIGADTTNTTLFVPALEVNPKYSDAENDQRCIDAPRSLRTTKGPTEHSDQVRNIDLMTYTDELYYDRGNAGRLSLMSIAVTTMGGYSRIVSIGNAELRDKVKETKFSPGKTSYIYRHQMVGERFTFGTEETLVLGQGNALIRDAVFANEDDILVGNEAGELYLWHGKVTNRPLPIGKQASDSMITAIASSNTGQYVVSANSKYNNIVVWDSKQATTKVDPSKVRAGSAPHSAIQRMVADRKAKGQVNSLKFSRDDTKILYTDGQTHVWRWREGQSRPGSVARPPQGLQLQDDNLPPGSRGTQPGKNPATPKPNLFQTQGTLEGKGHRLALFSHDETKIIVATEDGRITWFDGITGKNLGTMTPFSGEPIVSMVLHPVPECGLCVAVMDAGGNIGNGQIDTGDSRHFRKIPWKKDDKGNDVQTRPDEYYPPNSLTFDPSGREIYFAVDSKSGKKKSYINLEYENYQFHQQSTSNSQGENTNKTFGHDWYLVRALKSLKQADKNLQPGQYLNYLYAVRSNKIEVWDPKRCHRVRYMEQKFDKFDRLNVADNNGLGEFIVTGSSKGHVNLWHIQDTFDLSDLVNREKVNIEKAEEAKKKAAEEKKAQLEAERQKKLEQQKLQQQKNGAPPK